MSIAIFEGKNCTILRKPDFLFGDAASDTDQQLLAREGRWVYTLNGDRYYHPESRHHYPLAFFQSVTMARKMTWSVSRTTELVHVRILRFSRSGPLRCIFDSAPGKGFNVLELNHRCENKLPRIDFRCRGGSASSNSNGGAASRCMCWKRLQMT